MSNNETTLSLWNAARTLSGPESAKLPDEDRKMKRLCTIALLLAALTGCAARYERRMTQMMEPWVGKPVSQVIEKWGPPTTVYEEAPYKVYVWHSSDTYGGGSHPQRQYNYSTRTWEEKQVATPVHTSNSYRMYWVAADGACAK